MGKASLASRLPNARGARCKALAAPI